MREKECFAYADRSCRALKVKACKNCPFFKTKAQIQEEQKKVFKRIKSLDKESREQIMDTYYRGEMHLLDDVEVGE